jgi:hypothetical protein
VSEAAALTEMASAAVSAATAAAAVEAATAAEKASDAAEMKAAAAVAEAVTAAEKAADAAAMQAAVEAEARAVERIRAAVVTITSRMVARDTISVGYSISRRTHLALKWGAVWRALAEERTTTAAAAADHIAVSSSSATTTTVFTTAVMNDANTQTQSPSLFSAGVQVSDDQELRTSKASLEHEVAASRAECARLKAQLEGARVAAAEMASEVLTTAREMEQALSEARKEAATALGEARRAQKEADVHEAAAASASAAAGAAVDSIASNAEAEVSAVTEREANSAKIRADADAVMAQQRELFDAVVAKLRERCDKAVEQATAKAIADTERVSKEAAAIASDWTKAASSAPYTQSSAGLHAIQESKDSGTRIPDQSCSDTRRVGVGFDHERDEADHDVETGKLTHELTVTYLTLELADVRVQLFSAQSSRDALVCRDALRAWRWRACTSSEVRWTRARAAEMLEERRGATAELERRAGGAEAALTHARAEIEMAARVAALAAARDEAAAEMAREASLRIAAAEAQRDELKVRLAGAREEARESQLALVQLQASAAAQAAATRARTCAHASQMTRDGSGPGGEELRRLVEKQLRRQEERHLKVALGWGDSDEDEDDNEGVGQASTMGTSPSSSEGGGGNDGVASSGSGNTLDKRQRLDMSQLDYGQRLNVTQQCSNGIGSRTTGKTKEFAGRGGGGSLPFSLDSNYRRDGTQSGDSGGWYNSGNTLDNSQRPSGYTLDNGRRLSGNTLDNGQRPSGDTFDSGGRGYNSGNPEHSPASHGGTFTASGSPWTSAAAASGFLSPRDGFSLDEERQLSASRPISGRLGPNPTGPSLLLAQAAAAAKVNPSLFIRQPRA